VPICSADNTERCDCALTHDGRRPRPLHVRSVPLGPRAFVTQARRLPDTPAARYRVSTPRWRTHDLCETCATLLTALNRGNSIGEGCNVSFDLLTNFSDLVRLDGLGGFMPMRSCATFAMAQSRTRQRQITWSNPGPRASDGNTSARSAVPLGSGALRDEKIAG
jgi:hypothetical protein